MSSDDRLYCPLCEQAELLEDLYEETQKTTEPDMNIAIGCCQALPPDYVQPPGTPKTCAWCGCVYNPDARRLASKYRLTVIERQGAGVDRRLAKLRQAKEQ